MIPLKLGLRGTSFLSFYRVVYIRPRGRLTSAEVEAAVPLKEFDPAPLNFDLARGRGRKRAHEGVDMLSAQPAQKSSRMKTDRRTAMLRNPIMSIPFKESLHQTGHYSYRQRRFSVAGVVYEGSPDVRYSVPPDLWKGSIFGRSPFHLSPTGQARMHSMQLSTSVM